MPLRLRLAFGLALLLTFLPVVWIAAAASEVPVRSDSAPFAEEVKTLAEVLSMVDRHYFEERPTGELVESSIRGMLRTLDPHSAFFNRSDFERLQEDQQGRYYGLGILVRPVRPGTGRVVIVEPPSPDTPGYKAGLRSGDVIVRINGEPIDEWEYPNQVVSSLKGPRGTHVELTLERAGVSEPILLKVERDEIPIYSIKYVFQLEPGIGYIRIDRFADSTGRELQKALNDLGEEELKGLILDLRDNLGGSLSQAIEVSDRFLAQGRVIVSTRGRHGLQREFKAPRGSLHSYPMVVLINENSASASEIVSGALQDHDRALVLGSTSFGKALVQTVFPLPGRRAFALTTGKYYTPNDRLIQRDYSSGTYEYFYGRGRAGGGRSSSSFGTDGDREINDRGGIKPDEWVETNSLPRLELSLARANLFYEFSARLIGGGGREPDALNIPEGSSLRELGSDALRQSVTGKTLDRFRDFLEEREFEFEPETFDEHAEALKSRITQELLIALIGEREGYRHTLERDLQVQSALKALPRARVLTEAKTGGR